MEEHHSPRKFAEQPQVIQNEPTSTTQMNQSTQHSASEGSPIIYPSMDSPLLPQIPASQNAMGERARGEPAILMLPPVQESALAFCQDIIRLLGQIAEHQDGIMRELRMMRRDMRLMKGKQHRTNAKVVSLMHGIDALKKQFEQQ